MIRRRVFLHRWAPKRGVKGHYAGRHVFGPLAFKCPCKPVEMRWQGGRRGGRFGRWVEVR